MLSKQAAPWVLRHGRRIPPQGDINQLLQAVSNVPILLETANCVYTKIDCGVKWVTIVKR